MASGELGIATCTGITDVLVVAEHGNRVAALHALNVYKLTELLQGVVIERGRVDSIGHALQILGVFRPVLE